MHAQCHEVPHPNSGWLFCNILLLNQTLDAVKDFFGTGFMYLSNDNDKSDYISIIMEIKVCLFGSFYDKKSFDLSILRLNKANQ